ncbi:EamA-like transporter family protein [uncultured archaeon]|nr:EamA-like transporter family protein [uncultured archaeon]
MFYIPILGAFLEASGMIIEKKTLKKKNINYKNYTIYSFLAIVIVMIPFLFFFWKLDPGAFEIKNILIFLSISIIALIANLLIFYSLKRESLGEFEPIALMQPLFTILLAFILSFFLKVYSNENNPAILVLALIASVTLIITHMKKHHLKFDKYIISALIGGFLFAVELVLSKMILEYYSSWTFYFLRCVVILIIATLIFRPSFKKIDKQTHYFTWITAFIWIFQRSILYWGYENLGIIYTTIVLSILSPILVFVFAKIFLKEKITKKEVISAVVIVACVIFASLIGK